MTQVRQKTKKPLNPFNWWKTSWVEKRGQVKTLSRFQNNFTPRLSLKQDSFCHGEKGLSSYRIPRETGAWYRPLRWRGGAWPEINAQRNPLCTTSVYFLQMSGRSTLNGGFCWMHPLFDFCVTNTAEDPRGLRHIKINMHPKTMNHVTRSCCKRVIKQTLCTQHNKRGVPLRSVLAFCSVLYAVGNVASINVILELSRNH